MANFNPKQKIVYIQKEPIAKEKKYMCTDMETLNAAALDLDAGAFKLWVYLSKNKNGYGPFGLSHEDTTNSFGIKRDQYNTAVEKLIKQGYLVLTPHKDLRNYYIFYEKSQKKKEDSDAGKTNNEVEVGKNINESSEVGKPYIANVGFDHNDDAAKTTPTMQDFPTRNNIDNINNNIIDNTNYPIISQIDLNRVQGYYKDLGNGIIEVPSGKRFKLPNSVKSRQ